ncbi:hypothetical protein DMR_03110 [Solidesulfovibrio magneticus RS-1]|uniref:Uncharacterized protein n=1 Tax=Solidesulfovibrio magneticus (strain ATCC 700980 / DSM 13731 / RS-1) TaxID=573370 RepID=C4XGM2_SOLM1|nr:hypothetical protein DMR_03110 [Solidesulfovibrio magneticus RS-1]
MRSLPCFDAKWKGCFFAERQRVDPSCQIRAMMQSVNKPWSETARETLVLLSAG